MRKIYFILLILIITSINFIYCKQKTKIIDNENFYLEIPLKWELVINDNSSFNIINYSQEKADRLHPIVDPDWIKITFSYNKKSNSTLEIELNNKLKIYDKIISKEKIKLNNEIEVYSVLAEGIPNQNELFIIYYDNYHTLLIQCFPSDTEYINDFFNIVKSFMFKY